MQHLDARADVRRSRAEVAGLKILLLVGAEGAGDIMHNIDDR